MNYQAKLKNPFCWKVDGSGGIKKNCSHFDLVTNRKVPTFHIQKAPNINVTTYITISIMAQVPNFVRNGKKIIGVTANYK